jgi:CBS domain containing-hemolysin-like protein
MTGFGLLLSLFLVLLNGFFVAAEFALVKVRSTQLAERVERGNRTAELALKASQNLDAYLSATQLGITLASIGLGWVGEPAVAAILEPLLKRTGASMATVEGISFGVAFSLVSIFHIVLGELAPKSWAIQRSESLTLLVIRPLHVFYVVFRPIIAAMNALAALVLRPFGIRPASEHETAHSEDELRMLVMASGESGVLNDTEVEIAGHVLGFADKSVGEVMVPRVEITVLDVTRPLEENVQTARVKPYSRYPLVEGDHDDVIGVVHVKDLFGLVAGGETDIRRVCREVLRVPESKPLDRMLRDFQRERIHMAIVLDEYGGTAGIVTLEDVLEEIVGDIADEHDPQEGKVQRLGPSEWTVSGTVRLDKLNEAVGTSLLSDDHETLSGYVFEHLGHVPQCGETVTLPGAVIEVEESDGRRAVRLRVRSQAG